MKSERIVVALAMYKFELKLAPDKVLSSWDAEDKETRNYWKLHATKAIKALDKFRNEQPRTAHK